MEATLLSRKKLEFKCGCLFTIKKVEAYDIIRPMEFIPCKNHLSIEKNGISAIEQAFQFLSKETFKDKTKCNPKIPERWCPNGGPDHLHCDWNLEIKEKTK